MTLNGSRELTGISKSTLSRLESGRRRPTLELLLALPLTYRVPLDGLVGAPDVGDPRIRLRPAEVKGRTVIPLSREPGSIQAYILSGRVRLVLDQDSVLEPGDVAGFDTTVPHWFGSTGEASAEMLSMFGCPGERMHHRGPRPKA